jgi:hypothetical protein
MPSGLCSRLPTRRFARPLAQTRSQVCLRLLATLLSVRGLQRRRSLIHFLDQLSMYHVDTGKPLGIKKLEIY